MCMELRAHIVGVMCNLEKGNGEKARKVDEEGEKNVLPKKIIWDENNFFLWKNISPLFLILLHVLLAMLHIVSMVQAKLNNPWRRTFLYGFQYASELYIIIFNLSHVSFHGPTPFIHTLSSGFHFDTYIAISSYRTVAVVWTAMHARSVMCDFIVWENTNFVHFSCDIGKYSTHQTNKVFAWRLTPYSLDECCIFQYRTQINTVCISSQSDTGHQHSARGTLKQPPHLPQGACAASALCQCCICHFSVYTF